MNTLVSMFTLLAAIHWVETNCGRTSRNELQITRACLNDVNRIVRKVGGDWQYTLEDRNDLIKARAMAIIYLTHYGDKYRRVTKKEPSYKVYSLIYRLGYRGAMAAIKGEDLEKRRIGENYWRKVKRRLDKNESCKK